MVWASRFEDDTDDVTVAKPTDQRLDAIGVVGKLASDARRVKMHVECRFGDIDTDILRYDGLHLFQVLCLSCGPRPTYPFRPREKRRAINL